MKYCILTIVAGLTTVVSCERVVADVEDYVGRWNIKIQHAGDTFSTAWLRVNDGNGDLSGELMWKWGSVEPITDVAIDDTGLRFRRDKDSFRARLADAELRGIARMRNGDRFDFVGQRSQELCIVAGTWKTWPASNANADRGTIILERDGTRITGKAYDPQKFAYAVQDAKLDGRMLSFKAVPTEIDVPPRTVECEIRALDVTLIGRWLTVALNEETVHDNQYLEGPTGGAYDPAEAEPGPLLLQGDHGKVSYRNIVVTPAK